LISGFLLTIVLGSIFWLFGHFIFIGVRTSGIIKINSGLSFSIILALWFANYNLQSNTFLPSLFILSIVLGLILKLARRKNGRVIALPSVNADRDVNYSKILIGIGGFLVVAQFLFIFNGSPNSSKIAMRNGPDIVGWLSAGQFFCEGNSIHSLKASVSEQLPDSSIEDIFSPAPKNLSSRIKHLYSISSLTEQVQAEFLIGAGRSALPYLAGAICTYTGYANISNVFLALLALFVFSIFGTLFSLFILHEIPVGFSILFSMALSLSFPLLAPTLEGGFGQLYSLVSLLSLWQILVSKFTRQQKSVAIVLVFSSALSGYLDVSFLLLNLLFFYSIKLRKSSKLLFRTDKSKSRKTFLVFLTLILTFPSLKKLPELSRQRFAQDAEYFSGWNQGRLPGPGDLLGFSNWLPDDGISLTSFSGFILLINFIVLLLLICVLIWEWNNQIHRTILLSFGSGYALIVLNIYVLNRDFINNYAAFKFGQYSPIILGVIIIAIFSRLKKKTSRNSFKLQTRHISMLLKSLSIFLSSIFLISSIDHTLGILRNRVFTPNSETIKGLSPYLEQYETLILQFKGGYAYSPVIIGDVRYGFNNRGFEVVPRRANPVRAFMLLIPKGAIPPSQLFVGSIEYSINRKLLETRDIEAFSIIPK
jgi:hypothetical protein